MFRVIRFCLLIKLLCLSLLFRGSMYCSIEALMVVWKNTLRIESLNFTFLNQKFAVEFTQNPGFIWRNWDFYMLEAILSGILALVLQLQYPLVLIAKSNSNLSFDSLSIRNVFFFVATNILLSILFENDRLFRIIDILRYVFTF